MKKKQKNNTYRRSGEEQKLQAEKWKNLKWNVIVASDWERGEKKKKNDFEKKKKNRKWGK